MRLCHPPDGSTSPKYKLLRFITSNFFCKEKNALAFNQDRCCYLVLCLRLIPFHCIRSLRTQGAKANVGWARNPHWRGRISTVELLVLTILDHLFLVTFVTKTTLIRMSNVLTLSLPLQFVSLVWATTLTYMASVHFCLWMGWPSVF